MLTNKPKAFTLIDCIVIIVILAILCTIGIPMLNDMVKRTNYKEVKIIVDAVITGVKYYELKCDSITTLDVTTTTQAQRWQLLEVQLPVNAVCIYEIKSESWGGIYYRTMEAQTKDTLWLYRYNMETGAGIINASNPDSRYITDIGLP